MPWPDAATEDVVAPPIEPRQIAPDPVAAAVMSEAHQQRYQIDRRGQLVSNRIDIAGELTGRIDDDQRHLPDLFVAGGGLAGEEAVGAGIVAMIGSEHDDSVVSDVGGQGVDDRADMAVNDVHDLGVAIEAALPIAVRGDADIVFPGRGRIWDECERGLVRVVARAAESQLLEEAGVSLGRRFVGGDLRRQFPVGRHRRDSRMRADLRAHRH